MEENKNFDDWYRKRITENLTEPPADAWENIADELDTLQVWDRISAQLDTPGRWSAHKTLYYAVPLALLFLLSGGIYYYFHATDPAPATTNLAPEAETTATPETMQENAVADEKPERAAIVQEQAAQETAGKRRQEHNQEATASADLDAHVRHRDREATAAKGTAPLESTGATNEPPSKETLVGDEAHPADSQRRKRDLIAAADRNASRDAEEAPSVEASEAQDTHNPSDTRRLSPPTESGDANSEEESESREVFGEVNLPVTETSDAALSNGIARLGYSAVVSFIVHDSMLSIYPVEAAILPVSLKETEGAPGVGKPAYQKSIAFGVTASAKNTWLLNRTTLMGLEKHTLTTTLPDFGKDIGVVVTYDFSARWSAQAEGMFISEVGQRYQEYRNGRYVDREVDLRYYTMNLVMKYNRNTFVGAAPANGHALVGGIFAGRLHRATETIGDNTIDNANAYAQFNYGVLAGYEYNRYIFTNLVFTTGLRVNYGFPNIDALRRSRTVTGSFDVNVALKYRLGL